MGTGTNVSTAGRAGWLAVPGGARWLRVFEVVVRTGLLRTLRIRANGVDQLGGEQHSARRKDGGETIISIQNRWLFGTPWESEKRLIDGDMCGLKEDISMLFVVTPEGESAHAF